MARLEFVDLTFEDKKDRIQINFLRLFYFELGKEELKRIGDFEIEKNSIEFRDVSEQKAQKKFSQLLDAGFRILRNKLTKKQTVYIHQYSGIPLIGHGAFGIVDRGSSLIEVKPITSCNINCIYCSVDQDIRPVDFIIEKDYLVKEIKKLIEFKKTNIEIHFGSQGEVLLYGPIINLVKDLSRIPEINKISLETNGTLLNEELIDCLAEAGLSQFNLSINALDPGLASKIAGCAYDIEHVKKMARHISGKTGLIIAPVWIPGINDDEMPKLIEFSKELDCRIGIQNFLNYKFGRNPVKQMDFELFRKKLKELESRYKIKLLLTAEDFNIRETRQLPKPFRKGEIVKTKIVLPGRLKNEKLAAERERIISIPSCCADIGQKVTVKITRTKHNIFIAEHLT
jgi:hypothetical protein